MSINSPWSPVDGGLGASLATVDAILKEDYQSVIRDQLHREMVILQVFQKGKAPWNGKQFIVPLRVGGNTGIGMRGEGAQLPDAGKQRFVRILNSAKFLYGAFRVGGPDIAAAANGGAMGLANTINDEMKFLVEDIKDYVDTKMYHGGKVKGYVNEKPTAIAATTTNPWAAVGDEESATVDYAGDFSYFTLCDPAVEATWIRVELVEQAGYTKVEPTADGQLYVTEVDETLGTVTLAIVSVAAATTISAATFAAIPDDVPMALQLADKGDSAASLAALNFPAGGTAQGGFRFDKTAAGSDDNNAALEFSGIMDNLSNPDHHGQLRDGSASAEPLLRATVLCVNEAGNGENVDFSAINIHRIQEALDIMRNKSRRRPDILLTNPLTRHKYLAIAGLTQNVAAGAVTGVDLGSNDDALGYAGIPMKVDSNCPKKLIFGLHTAAWKLYELKPGDFDDTDGKILHQVAGYDRYEGFWKWYLELICDYPSANLVVCGFNV